MATIAVECINGNAEFHTTPRLRIRCYGSWNGNVLSARVKTVKGAWHSHVPDARVHSHVEFTRLGGDVSGCC